MTTVADALRIAQRALEAAGNAEVRLEADVLLCHHTHLDRARLYARFHESLDQDVLAGLHSSLARRDKGEPLAYITGHRAFFGLDFVVDRRVLIPRPETELLVETVLEWLLAQPRATMADVGAGSGAIAVSVAVNQPGVRIYALDTAADALAVARRNAELHNVARRITFLQGDLLAPLPEPADVLVANLPYVREDQLPQWCGAGQVELAYEPLAALDGGPDGLAVIRHFLQQAPASVRPGGLVLLEMAWDQAVQVRALALAAFPHAVVTVHKDLALLDRMLRIDVPE